MSRLLIFLQLGGTSFFLLLGCLSCGFHYLKQTMLKRIKAFLFYPDALNFLHVHMFLLLRQEDSYCMYIMQTDPLNDTNSKLGETVFWNGTTVKCVTYPSVSLQKVLYIRQVGSLAVLLPSLTTNAPQPRPTSAAQLILWLWFLKVYFFLLLIWKKSTCNLSSRCF